MKLWQRIVLGFVGIVIIVAGGAYAYNKQQSIPPQLAKPNYFEYYKNQDTKPEGKVGIYVSHLIMPENYREEDYVTIAGKSLQYLPWFIRGSAAEAKGIALLDPVKFYEREQFEPTALVDQWGNTNDVDGVPYIEKYRQGQVDWVPPRESVHLDHGYFLYTGRVIEGLSPSGTKLATKAKNYYHMPGKGFHDGRVPHEHGNYELVKPAMERLMAKYGDIPWEWVTADNPTLAKEAMYRLLDKGIDTLIIGAPRPVYSHHEEFNGSIKHAMHYIHEWQEDRDNHKEIKMIISRQLAEFDPMYDAHPALLRDNLKQLPKGASVKVVMSVHGMAWNLVPHEAWIELSPPFIERFMEEAQKTVAEFEFSKTEVVQSQDHFADPYNNPDGKYLSTNMAFWDGINEGFDYVVNIPVEFFAENTDTMFSHAMYNFENFDDFDRYEVVTYDDWSKPFKRKYVQEGTTVIYGGLAVGDYGKPISDAFFQAIDEIVSQSMTPIAAAPAPEPVATEAVVEEEVPPADEAGSVLNMQGIMDGVEEETDRMEDDLD